jgi:hypothetical protein
MTNVAKAVLVVLGNAIVALIVGLVLSGISSSGVISIELTHTLFIVAFVLAVIGVVATSMLSSMRIGYIAIIGMCSLIIVGGMLLWLNSWLQVKKEQQDALSKPPILNTNPGPPHIPISMFPRRTEQSSKASVGNQTKIHGNDNVVVGSLIQQGTNNIAQIGGVGNTAIINPEINPNQAVIVYDYGGLKYSISAGKTEIADTTGLAVFSEFVKDEDSQDWTNLAKLAEQQKRERPEWLTPYYEAGQAYYQLCEKQMALSNMQAFVTKGDRSRLYAGTVAVAKGDLKDMQAGDWPPQCK